MGFPRQECWSGLPFPSPGDIPNPVIKPRSPAFQADSLPSEPPGKPLIMSIYPGKKLNKRYMPPNVHRSTIYNSQDMEATQVSTNR